MTKGIQPLIGPEASHGRRASFKRRNEFRLFSKKLLSLAEI
jgi:hypothetical protein